MICPVLKRIISMYYCLLACSFLLFMGCDRPISYSIEVSNKTGAKVDQMRLRGDQREFDFKFGVVSDNSYKSHENISVELPESALLSWKSVDDKVHESKLEFKTVLGRGFDIRSGNDRLSIVISQEDTVEVKSVKK